MCVINNRLVEVRKGVEQGAWGILLPIKRAGVLS